MCRSIDRLFLAPASIFYIEQAIFHLHLAFIRLIICPYFESQFLSGCSWCHRMTNSRPATDKITLKRPVELTISWCRGSYPWLPVCTTRISIGVGLKGSISVGMCSLQFWYFEAHFYQEAVRSHVPVHRHTKTGTTSKKSAFPVSWSRGLHVPQYITAFQSTTH